MKKNMKLFAAMLAIAVLFGGLVLTAHAFGVRSVGAYSESGYTLRDKGVLVPSADDESRLLFPELSSDKWSCRGMMTDSYTHESGGVLYYCAEINSVSGFEHRSGGATFSFDLEEAEIDTAEYNTLKFALGVRGSTSSESAYYVTTYIVTSDSSSYAQTCVSGASVSADLSLVCADLSSVTGTLKSVRVVVYYNIDKLPDNIMLSSPYLDKADGGFVNAEKYLTARFNCENGGISMSDGRMTTDRNGDVTLTGSYTGELFGCGGKAYLFINTAGIKSGSVEVSLTYCENESGRCVTVSSPRVSILENENERVFPFDVNGCIMTYTVKFSGISSDSGFFLKSVSILTGEGDSVVGNAGRLSSVRRDGNTIRFEGSVDREAAKQYSGGSIGFYACASGESLSGAVEIGRTPITTKYEYTADLSAYPVSADTYKFTAAIISENDDIIPIGVPVYCDAEEVEIDSTFKHGFASTPAASAFEANASYYIADVALDELLSGGDDSTVMLNYTAYGVSDGDKPYSQSSVELNAKLLGLLDDDVNFCLSTGMKVYLRFTSSTVIEGLTYSEKTAQNYGTVIRNAESREFYSALVRFFAERYTGLDGFVIGENASLDATVGADISADPARYFGELAEVCRLTYNSCGPLDGAVIIVPLSDGARTLSNDALMLCDRLDDIGGIPLVIMGSVTEFAGENVTERTHRIVSEMGLDMLAGEMIECRPDEKKLLSDYFAGRMDEDGTEELTFAEYTAARIEEFCRDQSADAVFLTLSGGEFDGRDIYSALKRTNENGTVTEFATSVEIDEETDAYMYDLWDFGNKYYPLGWSSVGAGTLMTDWCKLAGGGMKRCLRAEFKKDENGSAGILICGLDRTADFSAADKLKITLAAGGEDEGDYVTAVIFLGTDDDRAEYTANVPVNGGRRTLVCDLTGYERRDKVDFVGVMVYAEDGAELEVEKISLAGLSEVLANGIYTETEMPPATEAGNGLFTVIVSAVLVLMAFVIFIMILRREKENADHMNETTDRKQTEKIK